MTIEQDIPALFERELGIPADEVTDALAYGAVPEWDSASHMIIVVALEEAYGIEFDPDDIVGLSTVGEIKSVLARYGVAGA